MGPGFAAAHALRRASDFRDLRRARVTEPALQGLRPAPRRAPGATLSASHSQRQLRLAAHAHNMRQAPSEPERLLWAALRAGQLGVRFRRQVVLQGFIVDFFAPSARLVVEVDGRQHAKRVAADRRRDRVLAAAGLTVLRLPAELVLCNTTAAVARVRGALASNGT
jgi:very-short-patch-repair endonuclease